MSKKKNSYTVALVMSKLFDGSLLTHLGLHTVRAYDEDEALGAAHVQVSKELRELRQEGYRLSLWKIEQHKP